MFCPLCFPGKTTHHASQVMTVCIYFDKMGPGAGKPTSLFGDMAFSEGWILCIPVGSVAPRKVVGKSVSATRMDAQPIRLLPADVAANMTRLATIVPWGDMDPSEALQATILKITAGRLKVNSGKGTVTSNSDFVKLLARVAVA